MNPSSQNSPSPAVGSMAPLLMVYDMDRAVAFYRDVLGFTVENQWSPGGHLYWADLKSGDTWLMLNAEHEADRRRPEHDHRAHGRDITLYFYPPDVVALRESILRRGGAPGDFVVTHYRHKQFTVRDPDGYRLCFSQETTEAPNAAAD